MRIVLTSFSTLIGILLLSFSALAIADDENKVKKFQTEISVASEKAISQLSQPNAFASDEKIKLQLHSGFKRLMTIKGEQLEKESFVELENRLNTAAGLSIVDLEPVVSKLLDSMSPDDALELFVGPGNAATEFLSKHVDDIKEQMLEPVSDALQETESKQAYDELKLEMTDANTLMAMDFINNQVETYREKTDRYRNELEKLTEEKDSYDEAAYKDKLEEAEQDYEANKELYEDLLTRQISARSSLLDAEYYPRLDDLVMGTMLHAYFLLLAEDGERI